MEKLIAHARMLPANGAVDHRDSEIALDGSSRSDRHRGMNDHDRRVVPRDICPRNPDEVVDLGGIAHVHEAHPARWVARRQIDPFYTVGSAQDVEERPADLTEAHDKRDPVRVSFPLIARRQGWLPPPPLGRRAPPALAILWR